MRKITLNIYNHGRCSQVAKFSNDQVAPLQCLRAVNDSLVKSHGKLPEDIFYFLEYTSIKYKKVCIWVDFTGNENYNLLQEVKVHTARPNDNYMKIAR